MKFKKKYITLIFVIFSFSFFTQNLSINDLFLFQKMNIGIVNDSLLAKKWKFYKSEEPTQTKYGETIWHFGKLEKNKIQAESWFYLLSADSLPNRIIYQFQKIEQFDFFRNELKRSDFNEIGTEIADGGFISYYKNQNYVIGTTVFPKENLNAFALTIYTLEDYLKTKQNK